MAKKRSTVAAPPDAETLLTPAEVADMFRVNPKTVSRWARAGKISSLRTLGGHRRFRLTDIQALLASGQENGTLDVETDRA